MGISMSWSASGPTSLAGLGGSGRVEASMGPSRHDSGRFSSSVPGGCIGSYSSVASLPASLSMMEEPPGCSGRKDVTSHTEP